MDDLTILMMKGFDAVYILTGNRAPQLTDTGPESENSTPAQRIAAEIAGMRLAEEDAQMLITLARRLDKG